MNELATTTNSIVLQPREITPSVVQTAQSMGEIAFSSGIYSAPKPAAAAMIMLKGYELGFPMTAAAEYIQVIDKQIGLTPRGALALMRAHPEIIRSVGGEELTKDGKYYGYRCTIVRIENGKDVPYTEQFTLDDARTAGLIKPNGNWEKYPRNMCKWRAIGFAADIACPDLLGGLTGIMKMGEVVPVNEVGAYDDIAPAVPTEQEVITVEAAPVQEEPEINFSKLIADFDAGDILSINNGVMPRTNAECAEIYRKLQILKA